MPMSSCGSDDNNNTGYKYWITLTIHKYHKLYSASLKQYTSFQIITAQEIKKSKWKKVTKAATYFHCHLLIIQKVLYFFLDSFTKRSGIVPRLL